ncbi:MAG: VOC family protein [Crocinitomicaceae bacterium]
MNTPDNHINYVELFALDLEKIKNFYHSCFGWKFTDYGKKYTAFSDSGINGGFELVDAISGSGTLIVIHHSNLKTIQKKIKENGGKIVVETFSFPGGKRFQFSDPSGNQLAVWTEE